MGSASPQGYLSGVSNLEVPERPKSSLPLYFSPFGGRGAEVNKAAALGPWRRLPGFAFWGVPEQMGADS